MALFTEYLKLVRLPGWGAYCITAVFGALSVGVFAPSKIFLLILIGILATLFGFVLNDYADVATDSLSKEISERPLVKGTIPKSHALYISIVSAVLAYVVILWAMLENYFIFSYDALLILFVAAVLTTVYNFYGKKIIGSDLFVALATSLYCIFGARVVSDKISSLTWVITIVTFIQILYMNSVIGGLKDADHDYKLGAKNIAIKLGVKVNEKLYVPISFKVLGLFLRGCSTFFMFVPLLFFEDFPYYLWQPVIMFLMFVGVIYASVKMLNLKTFNRDKLRKLISIQAFLRYSVVPVMLMAFIGYYLGLFLIIFPFVWFVFFNWLIYGKTVQPKTL